MGWGCEQVALLIRVVAARHAPAGAGYPQSGVPGGEDEALLSGERISVYIRSMARALVDGSDHARPMPALSAMLAKTASATEAYIAWVASGDTPADRRILAKAVHLADDTLSSALARAQERWGSDNAARPPAPGNLQALIASATI